MYFRVLAAAVVAFWIVMTGLLVQSVYFPESDRFGTVDPKHVARLFFENTDFQTFTVIQRGEEIAEVTLSGRRSLGENLQIDEDEPYEVRFTITGILEMAGVPRQKLTARTFLTFERDFTPGPLKFSLFLHRDKSQVEVFTADNEAGFDIRVMRDGQILARSMDDLRMPGAQEMAAISQMVGLGTPDQAEASLRKYGEGLNLRANRTRIDLGTSHAPGYVITMDFLQPDGLKLYFSEAGELVMAKSALEIELVADALLEQQRAAGSRGR